MDLRFLRPVILMPPLRQTFPIDHHPLLDAVHAGDPARVLREALACPDWPQVLSPQRCPMERVLTLYDQNDGHSQALRWGLAHALLTPLAPGALRHLDQPLRMAACHDWSDVVRMLVPFCDPNRVKDRHTALTLAAQGGHLATLNVLMPVSDPLPPECPWTPLMHAAQYNRTEAMDLLLTMPGLDPNHADDEHRTALHWAAIEDHVEATMLLLDHGVDPNLQDEYGWTPLMHALTSGDGALAVRMLERDATVAERGLPALNLTLHDQGGFTILDMAHDYQHEAPEIATLIGVAQQRQDEAALRRTLISEVNAGLNAEAVGIARSRTRL